MFRFPLRCGRRAGEVRSLWSWPGAEMAFGERAIVAETCRNGWRCRWPPAYHSVNLCSPSFVLVGDKKNMLKNVFYRMTAAINLLLR